MNQHSTQVVVLASRPDEGTRIAGLLEQAGYEPILVGRGQLAGANVAAAQALVVCHRKSIGEPEPVIPAEVGGHRLVIVSDSHAETTVVQALESGAHHYLDIDQSERLLQARLEAALRLHFKPSQRLLVVEPFTFDLEKRQVLLRSTLVDLSPKEYEFAYYLFSNRGRVVTNHELMTSVWSLPVSMDTRRIDTAACRVRKKMFMSPGSGWRLRRWRTVGYELQAVLIESLASA